MEFLRSKRATIRMDLAPLIDVMFQLLVFFMLTSSFMNPALRLMLPTADAHERIDFNQLVISIDRDGAIHVNHERVPMSALRTVLERRLAGLEEKKVNFRGDQQMPYQLFVQVMDLARQAGARQFNLVHQGSTEGPQREWDR